MSFHPRVQKFEHVKMQLANAIATGRFAPGDRLPSLRDLARHFEVSLVTVQRAIQELKEEEWLCTVPRVGIAVADPLPPMAHLVRLKMMRAETKGIRGVTRHDMGFGEKGSLRCLIHDEKLLPLFEWAAREYAEAYAPCSLRFEVQPLAGRDDEEAMRSLEADLVLLPSYAVNRAFHMGAITSAEGMLDDVDARFGGISREVLELVSWEGTLWAAPVMLDGPILVANIEKCRQLGVAWERMTSIDALLRMLQERANLPSAVEKEIILFNPTFMLMFLISAGHEFPGISETPAFLGREEVRALLERLRRLAQSPGVVPYRFDKWELADPSQIVVRQQPCGVFCRDSTNHKNAQVLRIPGDDGGKIAMMAYSMCVSARSVHPFEAWEWAAHLSGFPFQERLAEMGYAVPIRHSPQILSAFGQTIGNENAAVLLDFIYRLSRFYGMWQKDVHRYAWEVLGNELYRYVTGVNDYTRLLERVKVKTERYLKRSETDKMDAGRRVTTERGRTPALAGERRLQ